MIVSVIDREGFQEDGVICMRQVFSKEEMTLLKEGIEYNLAHLSGRSKIASRGDDPGLFVEDFCTWQENPFYKQFIFETALGAMASQLMDSKSVRLYHDHLLVKEPKTQQETPWHQDQPYYNVEGKKNCSFWIPVDPVPKESSLEFIKGSHLGPWLMPRSFRDKQAQWFPEGSLAELPDIESNRDHFPIVSWEMEPGDLVCFHMLSLHRANGVRGSNRRRVFSIRFLGDDMVYSPRPWSTSPDFPGLSDELNEGEEMDHPLFPLVFSL